jgi:hypothetical protein
MPAPQIQVQNSGELSVWYVNSSNRRPRTAINSDIFFENKELGQNRLIQINLSVLTQLHQLGSKFCDGMDTTVLIITLSALRCSDEIAGATSSISVHLHRPICQNLVRAIRVCLSFRPITDPQSKPISAYYTDGWILHGRMDQAGFATYLASRRNADFGAVPQPRNYRQDAKRKSQELRALRNEKGRTRSAAHS